MDKDFLRMSEKEQDAIITFRSISLFILSLATVGICIYTFIAFFVHWFRNDHFTFIQNFKWWLGRYIFIIFICWIVRLLLRKLYTELREDMRKIEIQRYKNYVRKKSENEEQNR